MASNRWQNSIYLLAVGGSLLAGVFLAITVFRYLWLGCDGGWYSYPGYAVDSGLGLFANREALETWLETRVDGVLCLFDFNTSSSIRVLFFRVWFLVFGTGIVSAKFFGLMEIALTIGVFSLIARRVTPNRYLMFLILAFLLNDKRLMIAGVGDLRPDISVTLFGGLLLLLFWDWKRKWVFLRFLTATFLVLAHSTSIVPFGGVLVFGLFLHRKKLAAEKWRLVETAGLIAFCAVAFLFQTDIMGGLLGGEYTSNMASSTVQGKILALWEKGIPAIVGKELARWQKFFSRSNIVEGLVLAVSGLVYLYRLRRRKGIAAHEQAALLALVACLGGYALLDPHVEQMHVYPMKIFYLIAIASSFTFLWDGPMMARAAVVTLIVMNTGTSVIWSARASLSGDDKATSTELRDLLADLVPDDRQVLVLGPTEIWPFLSNKQMVVQDNFRSRPKSPGAEAMLGKSDFVIINGDYRAYGWNRALSEYSARDVELVGKIKGHADTIEVYRITGPNPTPEQP